MNKEQIKLEIIEKIKMAAKSKVNIEYRIKALKPFKDYSPYSQGQGRKV